MGSSANPCERSEVEVVGDGNLVTARDLEDFMLGVAVESDVYEGGGKI